MAREPTEPMPMRDLMRKLVAGRGWGEHLALGRVRDAWGEIVGELVAGRSEPVRLKDGVLTVRADAGAWASEMVLLAPVMARKVDGFLGGGVVREVKVIAGSVGASIEGR